MLDHANGVQIQYTVGDLIARLAMIEASTTTTIVESRPPPYSDEPDAPLEKKPLVEEVDVEIVTIKHKPITTSVKATIKHLHRVGGFCGRWRGFRESFIYHALVNIFSHVVAGLFFRRNGFAGQIVGYIVSVMIFCRLRMVWTHAMIAASSKKPWYQRYCARKNARILLFPTFNYLVAAHATIIAPIAIWYATGAFEYADVDVVRNLHGSSLAMAACSVLSGPVVYFLMTFFATIPAEIALARIEASLLPEDEQTIVPFDRDSIIGGIDITIKGAPIKVFANAWKSITFGTRARVMSVYVKMVFFQISIILINLFILAGIFYATGKDQLAMLSVFIL